MAGFGFRLRGDGFDGAVVFEVDHTPCADDAAARGHRDHPSTSEPRHRTSEPRHRTLNPAAALPNPATAPPNPATAPSNPVTAPLSPAHRTSEPRRRTSEPRHRTFEPRHRTFEPRHRTSEPPTPPYPTPPPPLHKWYMWWFFGIFSPNHYRLWFGAIVPSYCQWMPRRAWLARRMASAAPWGSGYVPAVQAGTVSPSRPLCAHATLSETRRSMAGWSGLGRREGSTFTLDRAAPFPGRLGKPSLPAECILRRYSRETTDGIPSAARFGRFGKTSLPVTLRGRRTVSRSRRRPIRRRF